MERRNSRRAPAAHGHARLWIATLAPGGWCARADVAQIFPFVTPARDNDAVAEEHALWDLAAVPTVSGRGPVGGATIPVDPATVARFFAKCAPVDDDGHRWWVGAIDGGADLSGGYGRLQAGSGLGNFVTTTAHRYASTLADGPIPPGIVVRHRCDEPLCTAELHLERGTFADNRRDTIARPHRGADVDLRGSAGRSRAIRAAVLAVLDRGVTNPAAIGTAARAAMLLGDPYRDQLALWPTPDER